MLIKSAIKIPKNLIVLANMEFYYGLNKSKKGTMKIFKDNCADTKII